MKRIFLSALLAFALIAVLIGASQIFSWRATAEESAACCSRADDCGTGETCEDAASGQTACCDPNSSQCKGAKYCRKKPELE